jgi:hypothetical protein
VEIKEVVQVAFKQIQELYAGQGIDDLLLEEIRKEANLWYVTISVVRSSSSPSSLKDMFVPNSLRIYKVAEINASNGALVEFKEQNMIEQCRQLVSRYRRSGVVVDTNILLLYFMGRFAPDQITRFKRTASLFNTEDFALLVVLLDQFERLLTTPTILAEVSNLSASLGEPLRTTYFEKLKKEISLLEEHFTRSTDAVESECFIRLGLTDAAIHALARQNANLVLTADFDLYYFLLSKELDVINFNHLRPIGWSLH